MFTNYLAHVIVECGLAKPTIALLTAVTAAIFATVIFYIYKVLRFERWIQFFAYAFGLFTFQYLVQAIADWGHRHGLAWTLLLPAQQVAQALCSPANNLCLLAAARILLNRARLLPLWVAGLAILSAAFEMGKFANELLANLTQR